MANSFVSFDLQDGFVHNWLIAGPQAISITGAGDCQSFQSKASLAKKFYQKGSGITRTPVEPGPLEESRFQIGDYQGEWAYYRCQEDHLLDISTQRPALQFLRAWAYTQLQSAQAQAVTFHLSTYGPLDLWVNKKAVFHAETFSDQLVTHTVTVELNKGSNKILIRLGGLATPQALLACSLRVQGSELSIHIPTAIPSLSRRMQLEEINDQVYLDRDVYALEQQIRLCWPQGTDLPTYQDARLMNTQNFIYGQSEDVGRPGQENVLGISASLYEGPYKVFVMPRAWEYYESNIRVTKDLPFYSMGLNAFSENLYSTLVERRQEALINAARRENQLYAEIAKIALTMTQDLDLKVFANAVQAVQQRLHDSQNVLLGLTGLLGRFHAEETNLPDDLLASIQSAILGYRYTVDEPGSDSLAFGDEDAGIVFAACQILAGQLYPEQVFSNSNQTGALLRAEGEAMALNWMQEHAANGFSAWNSSQIYANALTALSYLIDLAESEPVFELASVLMDKILFSIALNSYKGVFGTTQGQASLETIQSGLLQATSGITRVLWGMGVFNAQIAGTVSFALLKNYELPLIVAEIAASQPDSMWDREQQHSGDQQVNTVTYRTPHYQLSSAQDYCPGRPGRREHIWQATFGPQSVVFVNHPGSSSINGVQTPNFWVGNGSLPRVAQWKNTLVAIFHLPEGTALQYTHAYFPTANFDEYTIQGNTAFARKADGYIALSASQGLQLLESGRTALRELRSYGSQGTWVCQMGSAASDGSFAEFQEKVLAQLPAFSESRMELVTLRGEKLSFGWQGPLTVDGAEQPLSGFKHFENPYTTAELPCTVMEIKTDDFLLRLDFQETE